MEIHAQLNYIHIAPRKVRLVANLIKGMDVKHASSELSHRVKRSSLPLFKLLKSAVANAKHNFQIEEKDLYVKSILVNGGSVSKRFRARAFGRAAPIRKRTSHVVLILDSRKTIAEINPPTFLRGREDKRPHDILEGGGIKTKKHLKKEGPVVRDATVEDIHEETPREKERKIGAGVGVRPKPRPAGFVRRVFQRKAI